MSVTTPAARPRVRLTSTISRHDPRCSIESTQALPTAPAPITPTFTASSRSFARGPVQLCLCWPTSFSSLSTAASFVDVEVSVSAVMGRAHTDPPEKRSGLPEGLGRATRNLLLGGYRNNGTVLVTRSKVGYADTV